MTARAHATFPLDYHSKNDLRLVMMLKLEIETFMLIKLNFRHSAKIKDDIWKAKRRNVNIYIMINALEGVLLRDGHNAVFSKSVHVCIWWVIK